MCSILGQYSHNYKQRNQGYEHLSHSYMGRKIEGLSPALEPGPAGSLNIVHDAFLAFSPALKI